MTPQDLKTLQKIHQQMRSLELKASTANAVSATEIEALQKELEAFSGHALLELRKIAAIAPHLSPGMTLKHYVSWIVPVERVLKKELRDDEFLIFSEDATRAPGEKLPLVFILHNLRSAFNVGAIFRTAECFGVSKIYLCGYTPLPTQEKLAKTAMGAAELVAWEEVPRIEDLLPRLKAEGYTVIALETTSHAVDLKTDFSQKPTAFLLGNERFGLEADLLEACTEVRKIPLRGQKNSLNVGIAAAIATYEFSRQRAPGVSE